MNIDALTESFKMKYEKFIIACDIIIASDDVIATSETEAAKALKATLK